MLAMDSGRLIEEHDHAGSAAVLAAARMGTFSPVTHGQPEMRASEIGLDRTSLQDSHPIIGTNGSHLNPVEAPVFWWLRPLRLSTGDWSSRLRCHRGALTRY